MVPEFSSLNIKMHFPNLPTGGKYSAKLVFSSSLQCPGDTLPKASVKDLRSAFNVNKALVCLCLPIIYFPVVKFFSLSFFKGSLWLTTFILKLPGA